jgi:hypothetical protein
LFVAAALAPGRAARFRRIETLFDLLLNEHLQISVNFFGQFLILPGFVEQVAPETG